MQCSNAISIRLPRRRALFENIPNSKAQFLINWQRYAAAASNS